MGARPVIGLGRVSVRIGGTLLVTTVVVLLSSVIAMRVVGGRHAPEIRRAALSPGFALVRGLLASRPAEHGAALREVLGAERDFCVAYYDAEGRLLARSRDDYEELPGRLEAEDRARALAAGGQPVFLGDLALDSPTAAVATSGGGAGASVVYVGIFESSVGRALKRLRPRVLAATFAGAMGLAGLASLLLAARIRRRILAARAVVGRIADGALGERLELTGDEELDVLARDFNRMTARLERAIADLHVDQARRRETFAAFSHEVNTPLANASAYLEALVSRHGPALPAEVRRYLDVAFAQVRALDELCGDLETLAALQFDGVRLDCSPTALLEVAREEADALRLRAEERKVVLRVSGAAGVASVDRGRMGQVLRSLLDNAVRHTRAGCGVQVVVAELGAEVVVEVTDAGEGSPPALLKHLGEPLFRADLSRDRRTGGRGLGLAIAFGLVASQGGSWAVRSEVGVGTTVSLRLPSARRAEDT